MARTVALATILGLAGMALAVGEKPVFVKWDQALSTAQSTGKAIAVFASIGADGKG